MHLSEHYIQKSWSKRNATFFKFTQIATTKTLPRYFIEAKNINTACEIFKTIVSNFSENEWKIKKFITSSEFQISLKFKNLVKINKDHAIALFKKRFSNFEFLRETYDNRTNTYIITLFYESIERLAELQAQTDFTKWIDLGRSITIPQVVVYFENGGIKDYTTEGLTPEDLLDTSTPD